MAYFNAYQKVLSAPGNSEDIYNAHIAGTQAVESFLTGGGNQALTGSIKTKVDIAEKQKRRTDKMIETMNYLERTKDTRTKSLVKAEQESRQVDISSRYGTLKEMPMYEVRALGAAGKLTSGFVTSYVNRSEVRRQRGSNVPQYNSEVDKIIAGGPRRSYLNNESLTNPDRADIEKLVGLLDNVVASKIYKSTMAITKDFSNVTNYRGKLDSGATATRLASDQRALVDYILGDPKVTLDDTFNFSERRAIQNILPAAKLPHLLGDSTPLDASDLGTLEQSLNSKIQEALAQSKASTLTQRQFNTFLRDVERYKDYIAEHRRLQKKRAEYQASKK